MRIILFLAASTFLSFSISSQAVEFNCQFTGVPTVVPDNGEVFTINSPCVFFPGALINQGQLTNNSNLQFIESTIAGFDNFGTYNNNGFTLIVNSAMYNGPSGTINNKGTYTISDRDSIENEGLFHNDGQFNFNIAGVITNTGTWINSAGTNINFLFDGGEIRNSGDFRVETGATVTMDSGSSGQLDFRLFTQDAGTTLLDGDYSGSGMEINGGTLVGSGSFENNFAIADPEGLTIQNATFEVGSNGVGQFDVTSKFACSNCTMMFDIAKPGTGPSDFLSITANRLTNGTAVFDGVLFEFNLLDNYDGAPGDIIDLVEAEGGFFFKNVSTNCPGCDLIINGNTLSVRVGTPEPSLLGLTLYAPTAEVPDPVATCFDLLEYLGGEPAVEHIKAVDGATQVMLECSYANGTPVGDDFAIELGAAYPVRLTSPQMLPAGLPGGCPNTTLVPGANLIGVGIPRNAQGCFDVLTAFGEDAVASVERLDPEEGRYEACEFSSTGVATGNDFAIRAGEGYIVHAHDAAGPVNLNDVTDPVCLQ